MTHNGAMLIRTEETLSIWIPHYFDSDVQHVPAAFGTAAPIALPRIAFRQNMHSCYRCDRSRDRLALPAS